VFISLSLIRRLRPRRSKTGSGHEWLVELKVNFLAPDWTGLASAPLLPSLLRRSVLLVSLFFVAAPVLSTLSDPSLSFFSLDASRKKGKEGRSTFVASGSPNAYKKVASSHPSLFSRLNPSSLILSPSLPLFSLLSSLCSQFLLLFLSP